MCLILKFLVSEICLLWYAMYAERERERRWMHVQWVAIKSNKLCVTKHNNTSNMHKRIILHYIITYSYLYPHNVSYIIPCIYTEKTTHHELWLNYVLRIWTECDKKLNYCSYFCGDFSYHVHIYCTVRIERYLQFI